MEKPEVVGLQRKKVQLSPYRSEWKELYEKEKKLLLSSIGEYILDIQHVGSTSIPGALAKPIIDIAAGVKSLGVVKKLIKPLKELGYKYRGEAGTPGRYFFAKGPEEKRTFYLHVEEFSGENWKNHIVFRDYLRNHKEAVKEYNELKGKLAEKYRDDRDTYTSQKASFIQKILRRAKALGLNNVSG